MVRYLPDYAPCNSPIPMLCSDYVNPHIRITTAQLNPAYIDWQRSLPYGGNDYLTDLQSDLGIEYIHKIELLDPTYRTARGLQVGDDAERFEQLYGSCPTKKTEVVEGHPQKYLFISFQDGVISKITSINNSYAYGRFYQ